MNDQELNLMNQIADLAEKTADKKILQSDEVRELNRELDIVLAQLGEHRYFKRLS